MEVKPNSVPSDGTEVENSTNVEANSVSPNDAKPIVGCSADLSHYLLPYQIPENLKSDIKECIAIRNGDTGLSNEDAKVYIKANYPIKVYAYLYGHNGNGGIATVSLLEMLNDKINTDLSIEKLCPIVLDYKNWNDEKLVKYYRLNVLEYGINKIKSNLKNEVLSLLCSINNQNNYEPSKIETLVDSIFSDTAIDKKLVLEYLDDKYNTLN